MNRSFFLVILTVMAVLIGPVTGIQTLFASDHDKLVLIENDWPPYFFGGKQEGEPEGFAKEVLMHCLTKMDIPYVFKFFPVKRMYSYLKSGELDIALFSYSKDRESFVTYCKEPIFQTGYRPVVLAKSGIEITSVQDFDPLRLGHLAGLKYSKSFLEYIKNREASGNLIVTNTGASCMKMLLEGIIDVFVDTRDTSLWRAKQQNVLDKIKVLDYDIRTKDYFVTISKNSNIISDKEAFLESLDHCLRASKKDGSLKDIAKKYGMD